MKIVIATPFYPPQVGVLATYAAGIEAALTQHGHEVVVTVLDTSQPVGIRHALFALRIFRAMRGASLVLALDTWSVGIPSCAVAAVRRVPLYVRIGGDFLWEQYIERTGEMVRLSEFYETRRALSVRERRIRSAIAWLLARASHVFFNTNFQRDIWNAVYGIDPSRSSVLENYYPLRVASVPPDRRVFVSANRSARYKNAELLEAAFARVKSRHPDIELDTSVVPHERQLDRIAASYATIIPSISEVGSNIAIESVVHGRPFIMSDDTGTKERLAEYGLFIDTRSQAALEEAIERLLDADTYARLAARATAFTFVRTWDDIARDLLRAIERI